MSAAAPVPEAGAEAGALADILVVEADAARAAALAGALAGPGRRLATAVGGAAGLAAAITGRPALVVVASDLPDIDGLAVCRALRATGHGGPILLVAAAPDTAARQAARDAGADDLAAPAALPARAAELIARPPEAGDEPVLRAGRLALDRQRRQVGYGTAGAELTAKEAELLACFMTAAGPLGRYDIFERVWGGANGQGGASLNVVDVYVGYLRTKLARLAGPDGPTIQTVRGRGFVLRAPP